MIAWLQNTPVHLLGAILLALMIIVACGGYALRQRNARRHPGGQDKHSESQESYVVSGVIGLLALLIGFTFAMVVDRYEGRRVLVLEDARAIETLYLRAQLLEEPHRSRFSGLLVRYVDNRLDLASSARAELAQPLAENKRLLADLWTATVPAFETIRGVDFSSSFVDSVNSVIELDAARKAARTAQIPTAVFLVLFIYLIVNAGVLGYVLNGPRGRIVGAFLLSLTTLALMLMSDMNRPVTGMIREPQGPMERLRQTLREMPPATFDRLRAPPVAPAER